MTTKEKKVKKKRKRHAVDYIVKDRFKCRTSNESNLNLLMKIICMHMSSPTYNTNVPNSI